MNAGRTARAHISGKAERSELVLAEGVSDVLNSDEEGSLCQMNNEKRQTLALFYCQNVPGSSEHDRRSLEKRYGKSLRLFPIPCSGRLESIHLLRALEEFADAAYIVTCPDGACRYFEGNRRAKKRIERTRSIISSIGIEEERIGIIIGSGVERRSLATFAEEIMERITNLRPSPVLNRVT